MGVSFFAWGAIGLYLSDTAEKKLGLEASSQDREALNAITPKIVVVDRKGES